MTKTIESGEDATQDGTVDPGTPPVDLADPALYVNRELSLLEFNRRVLAQACDASLPLLERLFYLTICSTNLDEFFEIRVAGLKQQQSVGAVARGADGKTPEETLATIARTAHELVDSQYAQLNDELLPALQDAGIRVTRRGYWTKRQQKWLRRFFDEEVMPVLTPIGIDPAHPFPRVLNKALTFLVSVEGRDAFGRGSGIAVLQVPRALPRLIELPSNLARCDHEFVMLSSIIHAHVGKLFPGMDVTGCYQFRVTRNSDLWVDEEETENLLQALQGELHSRRFGDAVRLEVADNCPQDMSDFLLEQVELEPEDLYRVRGPVNLHRLSAILKMVDQPEWRFPPFKPGLPKRLSGGRDIFEAIRRRDVLLHHPFESFSPVMELVRAAARDPSVLAIKQTLYRTGDESPLAELLIEAARNGKEVTALVELRARFDEAANIELATRLQEAGANIVYGIVGYKAHAKLLMVVRREGDRIRKYVHLGTGNYHTGTVKAYTDLGLLTADKALGEDVHKLFLQLTGLGRAMQLERVLQSPFTLEKRLRELIQTEIDEAEAGRPARIVARMNSLSELGIIAELYRASQAGVQIDLLVRGICCLRPGVPGVSENIRVRSVIGRFLEHSRVYAFHAGGQELVFASSADWMSRNLFRRVEACFPIDDPKLKKRVLDEALGVYFRDNVQAWELRSDGTYERQTPGEGEEPFVAQTALLERLAVLR